MLREPFDDRGLADARFANEHRVVLRAPREHLNHAADFFVAADDRVQFVMPSRVGQVVAVALEHLVLSFGVLVGHTLGSTDSRERLEDPVPDDAVLFQESCAGKSVPLVGRCDQ